MENHKPNSELPPIPAKRYFTIGEVSELCGVKAHVLRYWEQEFTQLKPVKRSGNRRYYQHHEVMLIRRIRELLYGQGFTISGARNLLENPNPAEIRVARSGCGCQHVAPRTQGNHHSARRMKIILPMPFILVFLLHLSNKQYFFKAAVQFLAVEAAHYHTFAEAHKTVRLNV